ncbi:MAG: hypothetical protein F6K17_39365 [Okeania sp. SIO3C4]|nr:hypothetical protein [Okeania sp. SIO3B3]NER08178.1 hypothetical protein [Okeania sp. SIO3C4]
MISYKKLLHFKLYSLPSAFFLLPSAFLYPKYKYLTEHDIRRNVFGGRLKSPLQKQLLYGWFA